MVFRAHIASREACGAVATWRACPSQSCFCRALAAVTRTALRNASCTIVAAPAPAAAATIEAAAAANGCWPRSRERAVATATTVMAIRMAVTTTSSRIISPAGVVGVSRGGSAGAARRLAASRGGGGSRVGVSRVGIDGGSLVGIACASAELAGDAVHAMCAKLAVVSTVYGEQSRGDL